MHLPARSSPHPLRVLHVIPTLSGGGAENFLCALAAAFDPSVVHAGVMPVYPSAVPFNDSQLREIEILKIERQGRYDPGFLPRIVAGIRRFRPDIVHAHLHNGKYWGRLAALAARVPIVVFTEHSPQGETRNVAEVLVDEAINRITDAVITFTEQQRLMLIAKEHIPAAKLTVIENGIVLPDPPDERRRNEARGRLGVQGEEFAVAMVGRLAHVKNAQLGIRALAALPASKRASVRLCVIGDGPESESLRELARSVHAAERVTFFGHRSDVKDLLYGADVLFIPSLVEGMPLAGLEAMTVGLPIISTPWPGSRELFASHGTGIVLADWEPRTAAAAFEYAAAHPAELREMSASALRFARIRYDIQRAAREHEQLYAQLARRKGLR